MFAFEISNWPYMDLLPVEVGGFTVNLLLGPFDREESRWFLRFRKFWF